MQPRPDFYDARCAAAFQEAEVLDSELRTLVASYSHNMVELQIVAEIVWGKPLKGI